MLKLVVWDTEGYIFGDEDQISAPQQLEECLKVLIGFLIYPFGILNVPFGKRVGNFRDDGIFLQDRKYISK